MPLPAALLARLKKRGIVEAEEEEVFAESYDDAKQNVPPAAASEPGGPFCPGCPNKWIPFHQCRDFCWTKWGDGTPESRLEPETERKRLRMKRKYPLPPGWREIYDPGLARHYYWNPDNDEVSWLSPSHPLALISDPAPRLAKVVFGKVAKRMAEADKDDGGGKKKKRSKRSPSPERKKEKKRGGRKEAEAADPMDPSSYSDVAKGGWSAGLNTEGDEQVTGADVTASGPLFQQRPYPSPGAVLRKAGKKPPQ